MNTVLYEMWKLHTGLQLGLIWWFQQDAHIKHVFTSDNLYST